MKMARFFLPVLAAGLITGSAAAATDAGWLVDGANTIPNTVANALIANGGGADWTAAVLVVDISNSPGSVHNGVIDSMRPQDAFWGFFPDLQWDTYVGTVPSNAPGATDVGPLGAGDLGSPVLSMAGQLISVTWGGTAQTETGATQIANITLTDDSQGVWQLIVAFAHGDTVRTGGRVLNGEIIPEPASLALVGLGGLAVLRRRR